MASVVPPMRRSTTRRRFLKTSALAVAGLALYSGEVERHWIDLKHIDIALRGLPPAFEGVRIVQLSDIHMDEFTEPFFLRHVVQRINALQPDIVLLTGDYVSANERAASFAIGAAWQCAGILKELTCPQRYSILGNHDVIVGTDEVTEALTASGIPVLNNTHLPLERNGDRIWLAGLDDPLAGHANAESAIPASIRNVPNEPVILMCHGPDYIDHILRHPVGRSIDLTLSGHTHGGQVRIPLTPAFNLPPMGQKYVEGHFQLGTMQLYVNRGIGTVGLPFRFNCPPEITHITLRRA
ncbi:metallophosphoesterase [Acidicapsa ligni]|uniref:metallophosphoesterase n=1 Tax=Acidicapsa ligni TaxID=542300 RepID=UPI0021E0B2D1|nr:metallophosphoesterase [Acidicapsa ligni]